VQGVNYDGCCFYFFVRNSLVALLEALCARYNNDQTCLNHCFPMSKIDSATSLRLPLNLKRFKHLKSEGGGKFESRVFIEN